MNSRRYFLIDGLGAVLSALLLGVVLVRFQSFIGMPSKVLYGLALIAGLIALCSFLCYFQKPRNWRLFLKGIAFTNIGYCGLTLALVCTYYPELTAWGITYFVLEMVVIVGIAVWELKKTKQAS